jgi:hypothetical protein
VNKKQKVIIAVVFLLLAAASVVFGISEWLRWSDFVAGNPGEFTIERLNHYSTILGLFVFVFPLLLGGGVALVLAFKRHRRPKGRLNEP